MAPSEYTGFALKFISGKYQGGVFPLRMNREIVIGRSSDLDMVLVEDMVSRKHARVSTQGGQIVIQDLGSTNGTFVNGEKVRKTRLKEGDRILLGTSIIKLVLHEMKGGERLSDDEELKSNLQAMGSSRSQNRSMSGSIAEVPLPDLLQLFSTSKKSGVLVIHREDKVGKVYLRTGNIYYATINDNYEMNPLKAMFRIITWQDGVFELAPSDDKEFLAEIEESVEEILMEGLRQSDELNALKDRCPPEDATLSLAMPLVPPLSKLSPVQLESLQLAYNYGRVSTVLDKSSASDLDTCKSLIYLLQEDYIFLDEE